MHVNQVPVPLAATIAPRGVGYHHQTGVHERWDIAVAHLWTRRGVQLGIVASPIFFGTQTKCVVRRYGCGQRQKDRGPSNKVSPY
jgi:hypothetical protein